MSTYRIESMSAVAMPVCDFMAPVSNWNGQTRNSHGNSQLDLEYLGCYSDGGDEDRQNGFDTFYREPRRPGQDGYYGPPAPAPAPESAATDNINSISRSGSNGDRSGVTVAGREAQDPDTDNGNLVAPMHIELCAKLCTQGTATEPHASYQYMAIFDGTNCYCGNDPPEAVGAELDDETGCNDSCPADITQICGDGGNSRHSSVYKINNLPPPNMCAGINPPPTIMFGQSSGNLGLGSQGGFAGSIAAIQLFRYNLDADQVECLYHFGQSEVATCKAATALPGVQYFQTFLPAEIREGVDFTQELWGERGWGGVLATTGRNDRENWGRLWDGFGTQQAFNTCAQACQQKNKMFAAMDFSACYCGNTYERNGGRVGNEQCAVQQGHCAWDVPGGSADDIQCTQDVETAPATREESCRASDEYECGTAIRWMADDATFDDKSTACAAAGSCDYFPEIPAGVFGATQAGCVVTSAEYCQGVNDNRASMDNNFVTTMCGETPLPQYQIMGGCTYIEPVRTADGTLSVQASCVATVPDSTCIGKLDGGIPIPGAPAPPVNPFAAPSPPHFLAGTCQATLGCTWQDAAAVPAKCEATAKAVCDAFDLTPYAATSLADASAGEVPGAQAPCESIQGCEYRGRRDYTVDSCHRSETSCTGSCGQHAPSKWCPIGSFPKVVPDHAECGMSSIQDLMRSDANFAGWGGHEPPPPCFQRMSVYQVGSMSGSNYRPNWRANRLNAMGPLDEYKGCFRTATARPAGVTLQGNAFFDNSPDTTTKDSGFAGMEIGTSHTSVGDGGRDMGIHFDGEGDYATINPKAGDGIPGGGASGDYASDGTFTVSLWATQPECNVRGREEWLFAHTKYKDRWITDDTDDGSVNSAIAIAYICTNNGEHSTAYVTPDTRGRDATLHAIRVYLTDDDGTKAVFDVPLKGYSNPWHSTGSGARSSGDYVTNEWVHIAIASNGTSVIPYIDGHRVPDNVMGVPPERDMTGAMYVGCRSSEREAGTCTGATRIQGAGNTRTTVETADGLALGTAGGVGACQRLCQGFQYFGLEWSRACFCDNDYGGAFSGVSGSGDDPEADWDGDQDDATTRCDPNGDGVADCGQGEIPSQSAANGRGSCSGAVGVHSVSTGAYLGCFRDQGSGFSMNAVADNAAWNPNFANRQGTQGGADVHNMALGTFSLNAVYSLNDAAAANDGIDAGTLQAIGLTDEGCFTAMRRSRDGWTRDRSINWNMNSPLSTLSPAMRNSPIYGAGGAFPKYMGRGSNRQMSPLICATMCADDVASSEECESLTDLDIDCSYTPGDAASCPSGCTYTTPDVPHAPWTMMAVDRASRCYCGVGDTQSMARSGMLSMPGHCNSGCRADNTLACGGRDPWTGSVQRAVYMSVYSIGSGRGWEALPTPLGPKTPMYLAGHESFRPGDGNSGSFVGNIADFALFNRGIDDSEMDCLFRQTKKTLGACMPMNAMRGHVMHAQLTTKGVLKKPPSALSAGAIAMRDGMHFCNQLTTAGACPLPSSQRPSQNSPQALADPMPIGQFAAQPTTGNFADDGEFSLSFWFSKGWCDQFNATAGEGGSSTLLAWGGGNDCGRGGGAGPCKALVSVQLVCGGASTDRPSTLLTSNVIRIHIVSDDGTSYETDVNTNDEVMLGNGLIVDDWCNVMLQVQSSETRVNLFIDQLPVTPAGGFGCDDQGCGPGHAHEMGFPLLYTDAVAASVAGTEGPPDHCVWDWNGGDCASPPAQGQAAACHASESLCTGACSQGNNAKWCPGTIGPPNIAYPDPRNLGGQFDSFNDLPSDILFGSWDPAAPPSSMVPTSHQFEGVITAVNGFTGNLGEDDRRCLYKNDQTRLKVNPR